MDMLTSAALLRLLQLSSSTLPVGAYSYSEGLETLVHQGTITTIEHLNHWLQQELHLGAARVDAAIMLRAARSLRSNQLAQLTHWNDWLSAARETEELRSQSLQMGQSLIRLFKDLQPIDLNLPVACHFPIAFGIVAATWDIDDRAATIGYLHSWAANLISAGVKLIPLGQTAGQRLLLSMASAIESAVPTILMLEDDQLESCTWGLSLASMQHETLYSRLFRS